MYRIMSMYSTEFSDNGDVIILRSTSDNCSCSIHLHGATIISWISNNIERLYLSEAAIFNNVKAIRGGIPVVFPQFGQPPQSSMPQHGFARTSR